LTDELSPEKTVVKVVFKYLNTE